MITLAPVEFAVGFHSYRYPMCDASIFERFEQTALTQFRELGIVPTHVSINGPGNDGRYQSLQSIPSQSKTTIDHARVNVLSFTACPEDSDSPATDRYAVASLCYLDFTNDLLACIVVNESYLESSNDSREVAYNAFLELGEWDFGVGFPDGVGRKADFHILEIGHEGLTDNEEALDDKWYLARPEERLARPRSVYPYNFLSERQLGRMIDGERTLRQYVEGYGGSTCEKVTDYGLHLWRIEGTSVEAARNELRAIGATIA